MRTDYSMLFANVHDMSIGPDVGAVDASGGFLSWHWAVRLFGRFTHVLGIAPAASGRWSVVGICTR